MHFDLKNSAHQKAHRMAFEEGAKKIGLKLDPNVVAVWGWRSGRRWRDLGKEVLVFERGYIGDRFKYSSIGWNGLNGHAKFPDFPCDNGDRFRSHGGILKPWKVGGDYILILGQVRSDASLGGKNIIPWYQEYAQKAASRFGKPVYFRPHPRANGVGYFGVPGIKNITGDLQTSLSGALFTISYNSNACLDSVLSGVPCFAGDRGTMAWNLCMRDLNEIYMPERESCVYKIAWTQWDISEIASGEALEWLSAFKSV